MIYFVCRSNILKSHKFFTKEPTKLVEHNIAAAQIDIWFRPHVDDHEHFEFYHFEKLFPECEVPVGSCSIINIDHFVTDNSYKVTVIEKDHKLRTSF